MQYTAIESNLDLLGQQQQLIWNEVRRMKSEISNHRGPSDEMISLLCAIQSASDRLNSLMAARETIRDHQAEIERQLTEAQASNAALTAELERMKEELARLGAMRSSG
jgi:chromosome segregation ATPase